MLVYYQLFDIITAKYTKYPKEVTARVQINCKPDLLTDLLTSLVHSLPMDKKLEVERLPIC